MDFDRLPPVMVNNDAEVNAAGYWVHEHNAHGEELREWDQVLMVGPIENPNFLEPEAGKDVVLPPLPANVQPPGGQGVVIPPAVFGPVPPFDPAMLVAPPPMGPLNPVDDDPEQDAEVAAPAEEAADADMPEAEAEQDDEELATASSSESDENKDDDNPEGDDDDNNDDNGKGGGGGDQDGDDNDDNNDDNQGGGGGALSNLIEDGGYETDGGGQVMMELGNNTGVDIGVPQRGGRRRTRMSRGVVFTHGVGKPAPLPPFVVKKYAFLKTDATPSGSVRAGIHLPLPATREQEAELALMKERANRIRGAIKGARPLYVRKDEERLCDLRWDFAQPRAGVAALRRQYDMSLGTATVMRERELRLLPRPDPQGTAPPATNVENVVTVSHLSQGRVSWPASLADVGPCCHLARHTPAMRALLESKVCDTDAVPRDTVAVITQSMARPSSMTVSAPEEDNASSHEDSVIPASSVTDDSDSVTERRATRLRSRQNA